MRIRIIILLRYGKNKGYNPMSEHKEKYKFLKKYIPLFIKEVCNKLSLPLPTIELYDRENIVCFKYLKQVKEYKIIVNLGLLCTLVKINNNEYLFEKFIFDKIKDRLNFILCHEIGHYYLHYKFLKHSIDLAYNDDWEKLFCNKIEYRKLKTESRADKLSLYFLKKLKLINI
jgi:Zn-dependent peptidase ImmA (M78 family)